MDIFRKQLYLAVLPPSLMVFLFGQTPQPSKIPPNEVSLQNYIFVVLMLLAGSLQNGEVT